jgi:hypothetical protein
VPFIRYTRDKRGYECTLVMHAYRPTQGPQRTRVLYLFRSPSQIKVGRRPLDTEVVEALEHTHPDLSFDWTALVREGVTERPEARGRGDRDARRGQQRPRVGPKPPIAIDDQSILGRVVGGAEAARLRRTYSELLERISRRSRTPEDRDRLTERAQRLNPDEWPDEGAARAGLSTLAADWEALGAELPQRRRGRRGGRGRTGESGSGPSAADPSGIMAEGEEIDGDSNHDVAGAALPDSAPDDGGDDGRVGSDTSAAPDVSGTAADVPHDD